MTSRDLRDYGATARPTVQPLYAENHRRQTVDLVRAKKREFLRLDRARMGVWDAMALLDDLVDDSDPDTELGQTEHALQTAEAIRRDGHPEWLVLAGLLHDLGKVLCSFGEPQWAVVGDTFPVGCGFSEKIVYPELFADNPDRRVSAYRTRLGIYDEGCGFDAVEMSWGHDEYLHHVLRDHLPDEALYLIRYHSFYAAHDAGAYGYLLNDRDRERIGWLRTFSRYDLYSKTDARPDVSALRPRYEALVARFVPGELRWGATIDPRDPRGASSAQDPAGSGADLVLRATRQVELVADVPAARRPRRRLDAEDGVDAQGTVVPLDREVEVVVPAPVDHELELRAVGLDDLDVSIVGRQDHRLVGLERQHAPEGPRPRLAVRGRTLRDSGRQQPRQHPECHQTHRHEEAPRHRKVPPRAGERPAFWWRDAPRPQWVEPGPGIEDQFFVLRARDGSGSTLRGRAASNGSACSSRAQRPSP